MARLILLLTLIFSTGCWANLKLTMFPVWHGDLIYIELPNNENVLLDTGREDMVEKWLEPFLERENKGIDYLILTHPHGDHMEGAAHVVMNYNLKELWDNGHKKPKKKAWKRYQEALVKRPTTTVFQPKRGDIRHLGEVKIEFFNPPRDKNVNDRSLMFMMTYGDIKMLFTGDSEKSAPKDVLKTYGKSLKAHVYKVPHHGLKNAHVKEFLDAVRPEIAICPCLPSRPNKAQKAQFKKYGTVLLNVKDQGTLSIETDGKKVWSTTEV